MKYSLANRYDRSFIEENIMGPNPLKLLEQLIHEHPISQSDTVLDLGCGRGVTSAFLAKECGARVFAADLWITPTENKNRFDQLELDSQQIIPISAEAHALPFAEEFFDVVVSVDSYHYFGLDEKYLETHLLPLVKRGGFLLIAVPGFKRDIHSNLPKELLLSWNAEDLDTMHDIPHWKRIMEASKGVQIVSIHEMEDAEECWNDWLACDNEYAKNDRASMQAGAGKYMNFIAMILRRK